MTADWLRPGRRGTPRGPVAVLVVAAAALVAACVPSTGDGDSRSAHELGIHESRARSGASDMAAPISIVAPPTNAPEPTRPTSPTTAAPSMTVPTPGPRPSIGGCPVFPDDHVSRAVVTGLPVRSRSARMIAAAGPDRPVMPFFSSGVWEGSRRGYPVNVVDGRTSARQDLVVALDYVYLSNNQNVPWPAEPRFEGWPGRAWDRHVIIVDSSTCRSWEGINLQPPGENVVGTLLNRWYADAIVSIDLTSTEPHQPGTVTSAGFSLLSGLIRYDEVASGRIDHALSLTMPEIGPIPVWPARFSDGRSANPDAPPMGSWLRLRPDADLSGLGQQALTVARALQTHGAVITDSGPNVALAGEPDLRWNDADLAGLERLTVSDFEVVDPSRLVVDPASHRIRR